MDPDEIEEMLDEVLAWGQTPTPKEDVPEFVEYFRRSLSTRPVDPGRLHNRSMPMFEVVSVSVKPKNTLTDVGDRPWQIHGVIQVTDEQGGKYDLYYQLLSDPEMIPRTGLNGISLTLLDEFLNESIFPEIKVEVDLKDGVQDLVKKTFLLDYRDYHDYDKVKYENIEGDHATVCVQYITYRAAVLADVELILSNRCVHSEAEVEEYHDGKTGGPSDVKFEDDHDKIGTATVSGTVLAKRDYISTELIRFPNESVEVKLGIPMVLLRYVVAVPAYSSLEIRSELTVAGCWDVSDIAEFPAKDGDSDAKDVEGPNGLLYQV